jgi:DNA-binding transcriptional MerR regulator
MRPSDLAAEHGLSTQAVRNYERDGFLPPAERTASGYRVYTETHAAALRAFLALVPAHGHAAAGRIMNALHDDRLDDALVIIDRGHEQLTRDRETLAAVRAVRRPAVNGLTVGELARRLHVTPATVRKWEHAGILSPARDPASGYRTFGADDIRDAELAHLLRRGHYPLTRIAEIVRQVREAGDIESLDDWQRRLTARGVAMLAAAARLSDYLS